MRPDPKPRQDADAFEHPSKRVNILFRTALLSWIVTTFTLGIFILSIVPYQKSILIDRMNSTARVVTASLDQVAVKSIVIENYAAIIEHCQKVVAEQPTILYLVITRNDGFSLVNRASGWERSELDASWRPSDLKTARGDFRQSDLMDEEVFHYSHPLRYSGIDWGWIHIGFSLEQYTTDLRSIYLGTFLLGLMCILAGSGASFIFARRLSRPILSLHRTTEQVADGNLSARAKITTGDEVEDLAEAFNQMAEALQKSHDELEVRVTQRTGELQDANELLLKEIMERKQADDARVQAEEELEAQRTLSVRADRLRSLGEMAAGIAHELNQPLVGVRGLAEHTLIGMQRGWELKEDTLKERLEGILEQADRMVHIIQHVRLFAREAGKPELSKVCINEVVTSSIELLSAQFRSHGIILEADLCEGLPSVMANPYSLEEVLLNLMSNARDAVEDRMENEDFSDARVEVCTRVNGKRIRIEVADNGKGIPGEILSKVFDPFFTTKEPDKGTGLGLAISRSIVEEFGGNLSIQSTPGQGTKATISLTVETQIESV